MSDDLDLRGGGVIAVDTATLWQTAGLFRRASSDLADIGERLGALQNMLLIERDRAWSAAGAASTLHFALQEVVRGAQRIAERLGEVAAIYELVELNARHAAAFAAGDRGELERLSGMRAALMADHPHAMDAARALEAGRALLWGDPYVRAATLAGHDVGGLFKRPGADLIGAAVGAGAGAAVVTALGVGGWGRVPRDARLTDTGARVTLRPTTVEKATRAPQSLAAVAARIPSGRAEQVRVERYTMTDGSRQYAVYVSGMREWSAGGDDPWDNQSNVELYTRRESASYAATVAALEAAGARPGDVVHAVGHSQGAMIAAHLTLDETYDTRTLVSFGSPVEADVDASTLSIAVRHTDDPVSALAGGGHAAGVGAPGGFIAERETGELSPVAAATGIPAHSLDAYTATASQVDETGDPRVSAVHSMLAGLDEAVSVEVTEYVATRTREGDTGGGDAGGGRISGPAQGAG
ncbi:hypothetical protein [Microbacterium hominis]|uniref:Alpha/beta hydrolase n=1 Tax=Microbacterium hominis TaxID=162426 RepID=A0A7D4UKI7_9MICO|nr:hypothetical protein [Microbacterium hominis]QKJ20927.1 hypothetical protein HQM25_17220 [Microbacterium hominis]